MSLSNQHTSNNLFTFQNRQYGEEHKKPLFACWEVNESTISDDYHPAEISAKAMFWIWARKVSGHYRDNLIPIYWCVQSDRNNTLFEAMPYQGELFSGQNFLNWFTTPREHETDIPIRWHELPTLDKRWDLEYSQKGGFFQAATGWKPACLQPSVSLDYLMYLAESHA